jgi:hypothetical protein
MAMDGWEGWDADSWIDGSWGDAPAPVAGTRWRTAKRRRKMYEIFILLLMVFT